MPGIGNWTGIKVHINKNLGLLKNMQQSKKTF